MLKKTTAIILALLFCLCAVGCADTDPNAPDGMKSATIASDPFTLYVPENWTDNTASGISSAYYSAVPNLSVSARYSVPTDTLSTIEAYLDLCVASATAEYATAEFELVENKEPAVLGGENALRITYKYNSGNVRMRVSQITAKHGERFVSLYLYCPDAEFENRSEVLESIRGGFVLGEADNSSYAEAIDKDTPENMKRASNKDIEYRLYVPKTWVCDAEVGASDAYCPDCRANVIVTSYIPDSSMSIAEYFASCEEDYKKELDSYSRTDEPTVRKVGGRDAYSYVYTASAEGVEIKIMQTILIYDSSFYTITYTARSVDFDKHTQELGSILDTFKFR